MGKAKQYTVKELIKIVEYNGYQYNRRKGSHIVYKKSGCNDIVIVDGKESHIMRTRRIIKENNLIEI